MKRTNRRLSLSRSTIRALTSSNLGGANGGVGGFGYTHDIYKCSPTGANCPTNDGCGSAACATGTCQA